MNNMKKRALTSKEVAEAYGVNEGTLANLRWQKQGPAYFHVGRKVVYRPEDVEAWLFANPVLTIDSVEDHR